MARVKRKVVRIGDDAGSIVDVSETRIDYLDEHGRSGVVHLPPGRRFVGARNVEDRPPWVEFPGTPHIRFTFTSYEEVRRLVERLGRVHLLTFDMT
jgi:hypothetical protein